MILAINGVTKAIENMNSNLSRRMDNLGEKIDTIGGRSILGEKIDTIGGKIDTLAKRLTQSAERSTALMARWVQCCKSRMILSSRSKT